MQKIMLLLLLPIFLISCATQERQEVRTQFGAEAMRSFPPKFERQMVNRTRTISVPDGTVNCTTVGTGQFATTNCIAGRRFETIPYTAVENVDINKIARDVEEKVCADRVCYQRFGNIACKTGEK